MIQCKCPYCERTIDEAFLYSCCNWYSDFPHEFEFECPYCKKVFEVTVEASPVFYLQKKRKK